MSESKQHKGKQKAKKAGRKAKREILRFYLLFPLLFLVIFFLFPYVSPYFEPQIETVSSWTAGILGFILNLFGMNAYTSGPVLALNKFSIRVIGECIGLNEMLVFLAIVLAFPAKPKKKLWGILFGIPALYMVNILRMIFITVIANYNPKTFKFFHLYFWQVAGILIIGGLWLFWIEKIVKYERETSDIHS